MTLRQLKRRLAEPAWDQCKHGHNMCALVVGGRCANELWLRQCEDETDDQYRERMSNNEFLEEDYEGTDSV